MLNIAQFIAKTRQLSALENPDEAIRKLMVEYLSDIERVRQDLLRSPEQAGDRFLRYAELFILDSWLESEFWTAPHDHGTWAVVGVYEGQEDNFFYTRKNGKLEVKGRKSIIPGEVMLLELDTIHAISNPLPTPTQALHVYGNDLFSTDRSMWNPLTMEESPFEPDQFSKFSEIMTQQGNTTHMNPGA